MDENRLDHLLNLYLDRALAASEKAELEGLLLKSAEARRYFWKHASLHALTREAAQLKWCEQAQLATQSASDPFAALARATRWIASNLSSWQWTSVRGVVTAAATALILFAVGMIAHSNRKVAVLARSVDVQWVDAGETHPVGAGLKRGWLRLSHGAVEIDFRSGARVVFEAPAELCLVSGNEAFCRLGRFRAQVPEEAQGFKLTAQGLNVVDLGTEFGLSLHPGGSPEVHVFRGKVELTRAGAGNAALHLLEGEAVKVEADEFSHMEANEIGFLKESELARWGLPGLEQQRAAWKQASRALSADASILLHYTFEDEPSWARVLSNQVSQAEAESHGSIQGCEWSEGRWPGKKALRFKEAEDRVRLYLPQNLKTFTLVMWARVERFPNSFVHSLMTSDREGPGSLRWTISQDGKVRLGMANDSAGPEGNWAVGMSPQVITTNRLREWVMLATTYDGKKMFHYLDGHLVWSGA